MKIKKLFSFCSIVIVLLILIPNFTIADPLDNWHLRYSLPHKSFHGVTYGNGIFVAVGEQGTILYSVDGTAWEPRTSGASEDLYGVTYGKGTFVAVGDHGTILISPDGETWTPRTAYSGTTEDLNAIAYGNGIFVAVGYNKTVLTSPDGYTWIARTFNYYPKTLCFDKGTFVSVSSWMGDISTSPDGVTWTGRKSPNGYPLYDIAFGNGTFVAVGQNGTVLTSPDGTIWTERNSGTSQDFNGVAYGNNTFVAVCFEISGDIIFTSPDGVVWTQRNSGTTTLLNRVTYGEGTFVAVGYGVILQSDPIPIIIETVSIPNTPIGVASGNPGTSYSYSTGGSSSNVSHDIEYQFDWGDGTFSPWSSSTSASKSWSSTGIFMVRVHAKCAIDTSVVSGWSLSLSITIGAGFVQRWAGPKSFNITFTETYQDAAGNIKFQSTRDTFTGTAELYSGEEGLVANGNGCYLSFLSDDGKMTFCIKEIASISTYYVKITTTDTFYLIGTGSISVEELGEVSTGIAYLDGKGTLKKNKSGDVISITVSGKIAGGFNDAFILRGTVNAILTK